MWINRLIGSSLAIALTCPAGPTLAQASFQGLGHLPGGDFSTANGVSDGGRVVVGTSNSDGGDPWQAFIWTADGGMVGLGALPGERLRSGAGGVSSDGLVVVGGAFVGEAQVVVYWTADGRIHRLGDPPGGKIQSFGASVSGDGSAIAGTFTSALGMEPFIWTASTGMIGLGPVLGSTHQAGAGYISEDGLTLTGGSASPQGYQAWRWQAHTGAIGLGSLPGPGLESAGCCSAADGRIVAGRAYGQGGRQIFRWTEGYGMVGLGFPPPATTGYTTPTGMDRQGWRIVGISYVPREPRRALLWEAHRGMRILREILEQDYNLDLGEWELDSALHISPCGTAIVGVGVNPEGQAEGWLVRIPHFCYADCDQSTGLGTLDVFDFQCFQSRFLEADILYADCDQNGVLDFFDFLCFQNEFLAGCP